MRLRRKWIARTQCPEPSAAGDAAWRVTVFVADSADYNRTPGERGAPAWENATGPWVLVVARATRIDSVFVTHSAVPSVPTRASRQQMPRSQLSPAPFLVLYSIRVMRPES